MECQQCGSEMRLYRRSDALQGEICWYRCRRCDSGQMTSVQTGLIPVTPGETTPVPAASDPPRIWHRMKTWLGR